MLPPHGKINDTQYPNLMPRRRIYILNYQDYLQDIDPPRPARLRPALRIIAFSAAILGFGFLLFTLIAEFFPADNVRNAVFATASYVLVILLFISLAKRLNRQ
jgi:hypothetical protein